MKCECYLPPIFGPFVLSTLAAPHTAVDSQSIRCAIARLWYSDPQMMHGASVHFRYRRQTEAREKKRRSKRLRSSVRGLQRLFTTLPLPHLHLAPANPPNRHAPPAERGTTKQAIATSGSAGD